MAAERLYRWDKKRVNIYIWFRFNLQFKNQFHFCADNPACYHSETNGGYGTDYSQMDSD